MGPLFAAVIAAMASVVALEQPFEVPGTSPWVSVAAAIGLVVLARLSAQAHAAKAVEEGATTVHFPAWHALVDLGVFIWLTAATTWPGVASEAVGDLPGLSLLAVFAPWLIAQVARADAAWLATRATGGHRFSRAQAAGFHARLLLVPSLPLLAISSVVDALEQIPALEKLRDAFDGPLALATHGFALVLVALLMAPILRLLLRGRPLTEGPVAEALHAYLARIHFRLPRIDQVDTDGAVANAVFVGVLPFLRGVFITDVLINRLDVAGNRAVFAHEVGHGVRRHLLWNLLFFLSAGILTSTLATLGGVGVYAGTMIGVAALMFGMTWLSRRFEVEADLWAAATLDSPEEFISALETVGVLAGPRTQRDGMRHFGIVKRVAIVREWADNPASKAAWRAFGRNIRAGILAVLVGAIIFAATQAPETWQLGCITQELTAAEVLAHTAGKTSVGVPAPHAGEDYTLATRAIQRARDLRGPGADARGAPDDVTTLGIMALMTRADLYLRDGNYTAARADAADVMAHWPAGDKFGDFNRLMLAGELAAVDGDFVAARAAAEAMVPAYEDLKRLMAEHTPPPRRRSRRDAKAPDPNFVEADIALLLQATQSELAPTLWAADATPAARLIAIVRYGSATGAGIADVRDARAHLANDAAWRRAVLDRVLAGRPLDAVLATQLGFDANGTNP